MSKSPLVGDVRRGLSIGLVLMVTISAVVTFLPSPPVAAAGQISLYKTGLDWPIALAFASDGRIFYDERFTGSIRIIQNGTLLPTPFYTLNNTDTAGERGLLGLALDPGFPATPYVYAYHTYIDTANGTTYNRIVRILANGNVGVSHTVILRLPPLSLATNHNGGVIDFGPDGKLYAVVGENADPALSQNLMSPMGKVLRMNSNGTAPPDNPYYGNASANNLIFTYGHRNMFGLAFHPVTHRVYVTENGPNCNDEINLLTAGKNFGWGPSADCSTGTPPNNTNRDGPNPVLPIWWWGPTICPTNAAIYGGPYFPAYRGDMFMGECNYNRFHRLHLVPPNYDRITSDTIVWTAPSIILEVKQGPDGAIWITTPSEIYRYWDSAKPPVASFTAAPNPALVNTSVKFNASSSFDPDGRIVSFAWDFGDTTNGTGMTVSHTYTTWGTFNATLTVTDNESYTATAFRYIAVQAPPVAAFSATPNPAFVNQTVTFDGSASYDPDGSIVSYSWTFGDTSGGSGAIVSHAFSLPSTYNSTLIVTDSQGHTASASHDVVVHGIPPGPQPPVASFTATPNPALTNQTVRFNASASYDPDGSIVSYAWNFGDNATGNGTIVTHAYARSGTLNATLTVTDNQSLTSATYVHVVVRVPQPPVALFAATPSPVNPGIPVTFNASASYDPDAMIVSYTWDLGDANTSTGIVVTHAYSVSGLYHVLLTVLDNQGLSSNTTHTVSINFSPLAVIELSAPPLGVYIGTTVTFDGSRSFDRDGTIVSYTWDFGDGTSGLGVQVYHSYTAKGFVYFTLTVVDNLGLSSTTVDALVVQDRAPQIISTAPPAGNVTVNAGATQSFTVTATDPDGDRLAYLWVVDGLMQSPYTNSFDFSAAGPGTHTVNVTVTDHTLSTWQEWTVTVVVNETPVPPPLGGLWPVALIPVLMIAGAIVVVLIRRRGRRKTPHPPPPSE